MTIFEYIMVMVSVILALALAQLLRALSEITTNRNGYWVHNLWLAFLVVTAIQAWWAFWDQHEFEAWTVVAYLHMLSMPVLMFVAVHILVPATRTVDTDWRDHFYRVKTWFFLIMLVLIVDGILGSLLLFGAPPLHAYRLFQAAIIVLLAAGVIANSHRTHGVLVVAAFVTLILSQLMVRMDPAALD